LIRFSIKSTLETIRALSSCDSRQRNSVGDLNLSILGLWEFSVDRGATIDAYARQPLGGSDSCQCNGCRNFAAARESAYPAEFRSLLESLGIDYRKDGEAGRTHRTAPHRHGYQGWFHFVGVLEKTGDFPTVPIANNFEVWLVTKSAPSLPSLHGLGLIELCFYSSAVPWVLPEDEPI
jgi:hypothetical protein